MKKVIIELKNVYKEYVTNYTNVLALNDINLKIYENDFIAVVGPSGSGKTTLLNIIGALDKPTKGKVIFKEQDLTELSDKELSKYRAENVGFVFQTFNLIPSLNVLENVKLPSYFSSKKIHEKKFYEILDLVGLKERIFHKPLQLSGGEQQRVAIARALINDPVIILADEPTGNLDSKSAESILRIFLTLKESGKTIVMATHNLRLLDHVTRIIYLQDGAIINEVIK